MKYPNYDMISVLVCLLFLSSFVHSQSPVSVFEIIDKDPQKDNSKYFNTSHVTLPITKATNLQDMLQNLATQVTNPYLKGSFTVENIANYLANILTGNLFLTNLQVKDLTELSNVEVTDRLKVKGEAQMDSLGIKKLKTKGLTIEEDKIEIDPTVKIKVKNSNLKISAKDIFEVVAFMKYILKICGNKLEKCDFNFLTKTMNNRLTEKEKKGDDMQLLEKESRIKHLRKDKERDIYSHDDPSAFFEASRETLEEIEKELDNEVKSKKSTFNDDSSLIDNPHISEFVNDYYYEDSSKMRGDNQDLK